MQLLKRCPLLAASHAFYTALFVANMCPPCVAGMVSTALLSPKAFKKEPLLLQVRRLRAHKELNLGPPTGKRP